MKKNKTDAVKDRLIKEGFVVEHVFKNEYVLLVNHEQGINARIYENGDLWINDGLGYKKEEGDEIQDTAT